MYLTFEIILVTGMNYMKLVPNINLSNVCYFAKHCFLIKFDPIFNVKKINLSEMFDLLHDFFKAKPCMPKKV